MKKVLFEKKSFFVLIFALLCLLLGLSFLSLSKKEKDETQAAYLTCEVRFDASSGSYSNGQTKLQHQWANFKNSNFGFNEPNVKFTVKFEYSYVGFLWFYTFTQDSNRSVTTDPYLGDIFKAEVERHDSMRLTFTLSYDDYHYTHKSTQIIFPELSGMGGYINNYTGGTFSIDSSRGSCYISVMFDCKACEFSFFNTNNVPIEKMTGYAGYLYDIPQSAYEKANKILSHKHVASWIDRDYNLPASVRCMIFGNITEYIPYHVEEDSYKITWETNGGSWTSAPKTSYTYSELFNFPSTSDVKKTGYTLSGWKIEGGNKDGSTVSPGVPQKGLIDGHGSEITITAQWTPNTYYVRFNAGSGTTGTMNNQSFTYNANEKELTANAFKKTGYYFAGWSTSSSATSVNYADKAKVKNLSSGSGAIVDLYAVWKKETYVINFKARADEYVNGVLGGTAEIEEEYGGGPITIYAQSLNASTGKSVSIYKEGNRLTGLSGSESSSTKLTNCDFSSKYSNTLTISPIPDFTPNVGESKTSVIAYALWEKETYNITFNAADGQINKGKTYANTYTYGESITISRDNESAGSRTTLCLYRKGYKFNTFDKGSISSSNIFTIPDLGSDKNVDSSYKTIKASWTVREYDVLFDKNGAKDEEIKGSWPDTKNKIKYTDSLTMPTVERLGYIFVGWKRQNSNQTEPYHPGKGYNMSNIMSGIETSTSTTLVAQWQDTWASKGTDPNPNNNVKNLTTPEDFGWLAYELQNGTTFEGITLNQRGNVNLYNNAWLSTGTFKGIFNGNGYYIYNIHTTDNKDVLLSDNVGLFAKTDGTSNNVQLNNITILSGNLKGNNNVGGIVGEATNTIIKNCRNSASVSGNNYVGGIVGKRTETVSTNASATITSCINYGKVEGNSAVGGLIGNISNSTIDACYVRANVNGSSNTGGLIGTGTSVTIKNSAYVENTTTPSSVNWVAGSMTGGEVCDCLIKTLGAEISFPSNATNCVGYVNNGTPKTSQPTATMSYANWTTVNGQWFPKGLTWLA